MAKQPRAVATRAAILSAAASLFQASGYGNTAISDISSASGVTKGALYFHFASKEEVAQAIIAAQHQASIAIGRALLEGNVRGIEAIVRMSMELARQLVEDPIVRAGIRLTFEASSFTLPVVSPYEDWISAGAEFLKRAVAEGDAKPDLNVEATAHFIIPAFTGVQLVSDVLTGRTDIYQRLEEMWALLLPQIVTERKLAEMLLIPKRAHTEVASRPVARAG